MRPHPTTTPMDASCVLCRADEVMVLANSAFSTTYGIASKDLVGPNSTLSITSPRLTGRRIAIRWGTTPSTKIMRRLKHRRWHTKSGKHVRRIIHYHVVWEEAAEHCDERALNGRKAATAGQWPDGRAWIRGGDPQLLKTGSKSTKQWNMRKGKTVVQDPTAKRGSGGCKMATRIKHRVAEISYHRLWYHVANEQLSFIGGQRPIHVYVYQYAYIEPLIQ
jgi:hypothetical protein